MEQYWLLIVLFQVEGVKFAPPCPVEINSKVIKSNLLQYYQNK